LKGSECRSGSSNGLGHLANYPTIPRHRGVRRVLA
jgi:hypothetical protein